MPTPPPLPPLPTAKQIGDGVSHLGEQINNAATDLGRNAGREARGLVNTFCSIMTGGGSDRGTAACEIDAGVGYQSNGDKGKYYTYDPKNPDVHHDVTNNDLKLPSVTELQSVKDLQSKEVEQWERDEEKRWSQLFFLKPGDVIGLPWKGFFEEVRLPTQNREIRKGGAFLDLRHDPRYPGAYRYHGGIDLLNKVGEPVASMVSGTVVHVIKPTKDSGDLRGILIKNQHGYLVQELYFLPDTDIKPGAVVRAGQKIGVAQDIHMMIEKSSGKKEEAYPKDVPQHLHVTVKDPQGRFVDPEGKVILLMHKGSKPEVLVGH